MLDEAVGEYRRALALGPTFVDIRLKLADVLRDMGDHEDGAVGVRGDPHGATPTTCPGGCTTASRSTRPGRKEDAVAVWEDVLARNPGNKSAEMYLNLVRDGTESECWESGRV